MSATSAATVNVPATPTPPAPVRFQRAAIKKGEGNTVYDGPIENLPYPEKFDLEAAIEQMYTDGYCIVPRALTAQSVAELRDKIDHTGGDDAQYEVKNWCFNKNLPLDYHKDPFWLKYIDVPNVIDVIYAIMGENCHFRGGSTWVTGRGRKMGLHIDTLPMQLPEDILADPRVRVPIFMCPVQFYLDDLTLDIGPTILVPGSHRSGRWPTHETTWHGIAPKAAMVKAGDAVIFRFDLWHGAAGNTGDRRRYIMQLGYGARVAPISVPLGLEGQFDESVRTQATPRQKRLLWGESSSGAY